MSLRERWQSGMAKIDALSLRERFFLLLSTLVCTVGLMDALWLSPATKAHTQLVQRHQAQAAELSRLRAELVALPRPAAASAGDAAGVDMQTLEARSREVEAQIAALWPAARTGPELEQVLTQLLRRHDGLTLGGMQTLPADTTSPAGAVPRRGVELQVSGPYPELVRYLRATEQALPDLRWGPLQLKNPPAPPQLTLRLYVLGERP